MQIKFLCHYISEVIQNNITELFINRVEKNVILEQ